MSIFTESISYRPFIYSWAVDAEKKHRIDMNWHENQIELQDDLRQYNMSGGMATENVSHESNKNILEKLLLLFTEMDVQVGSGYTKILPYVKNNEIRTLLMTFAQREVCHQRAYALAAETFGYSNSDWSEFKNYEEMMDKIDIISQNIGDLSKPLNFAKQLSVIFLGEGIALFGAFACMLNLKRFGIMQNFNTINEWSLKDEHDHVMNNIRILRTIMETDLDENEIIEFENFVTDLVEKYIQAEHNFLDLVFAMGDQEKMSLNDTKQFITYLGKLRLSQIGFYEKELPKNPLDWIDYILSASTHTNFFESRVVDYTHNKLDGKINYEIYKSHLENRLLGEL